MRKDLGHGDWLVMLPKSQDGMRPLLQAARHICIAKNWGSPIMCMAVLT